MDYGMQNDRKALITDEKQNLNGMTCLAVKSFRVKTIKLIAHGCNISFLIMFL